MIEKLRGVLRYQIASVNNSSRLNLSSCLCIGSGITDSIESKKNTMYAFFWVVNSIKQIADVLSIDDMEAAVIYRLLFLSLNEEQWIHVPTFSFMNLRVFMKH